MHVEESIKSLVNFRSLMSAYVSKEDIRYFYGRSVLKEIDSSLLNQLKDSKTPASTRKYIYARANINYFLIRDFVKFIGVSGSVGAGFAKETDDIDLFVVLKDNTAWLYRIILQTKDIFNNKLRTHRSKSFKDKFCMNFLVEERGLKMDNDIFNFHELMYLKSVYGEKYINYIYSQNEWLKDWCVRKENLVSKVTPDKKKNIFVIIANFISFFLQIIFMFLSFHKPDVKRLIAEYKDGKISFYEKDFRPKKLKKYYKSFKLNN